MLSNELLKDRLQSDEGCSNKSYKDILGNWTIGIGHKLSAGNWLNYQVSDDQIEEWFQADLAQSQHYLESYSWYKELDDVRQSILVCLMFNIGPGNFAKFVNMIADLAIPDYNKAADELEDSLWATQVPRRADLYIEILREGKWIAPQ